MIAAFIGQHVTGSNKNARDVLSKAKELQKNGKPHQNKVTEHFISKFDTVYWMKILSLALKKKNLYNFLRLYLCSVQSSFLLLIPTRWTCQHTVFLFLFSTKGFMEILF